jgi:3-methyladenine DNA glycosylase/8-oxoguanine DNA glycosylase
MSDRAHRQVAEAMTPAAAADPAAREFLRNADPVLARLIDARPDFRPRAWLDELPQLDAFGTLIFQVAGQQLSVNSTRAIMSHLQERFGGHLPSPVELLGADPQLLRDSGFSARKGATLRALAERFVDGRLSDESLSRMSDDEVEARLLAVPGVGPYAAAHIMMLLGRYSRLILDSWTRPKYLRVSGAKQAKDSMIERRFRRYGPYAGLAFWLYLTRDWVEE